MYNTEHRKFPYSGNCPICSDKESSHHLEEKQYTPYIKIICPTCGVFKITRNLYYPDTIKDNPNKYILSALIREANENTQPIIELDTNNIDNYLSNSRKPATFTERLDKILLFINKKTNYAGQYTQLSNNDYSICFALNKDEFYYMLEVLHKEDFIEFRYSYGSIESWPDKNYSPVKTLDYVSNYEPIAFVEVRPTINGWKKIDELRRSNIINSKQCFVAMAFNSEMEEIYKKGIEPGIRNAGYDPYKINNEPHNEQIPLKIMVEIRQSKVVVADFTGQNNGAYFEAGFAFGLGKPVIWTCKKSDLPQCHFDTKTFNHILWETPEDFRDQLTIWLKAIVPLENRI
jgi:nucleoside 2-deoxyribosyltransferase